MNLRPWRPVLAGVGVTFVAAVVGLRWTDAALVGLVAAVVTVAASMAGSQVRPPSVPMLKSGSRPGNRNGINERIEWQS